MRGFGGAAAVVLVTVGSGWADEPVVPAAGRECLPPVFLPYCPPAPRPPLETVRPIDPTRPPPTAKDSATPPAPPPSTDALARTPEAGTLSAAIFNPNMFGDAFGGQAGGAMIRNTRRLNFILRGLVPSEIGPLFQPIEYFALADQGSTTVRPTVTGSVVFLTDNGRTTSFQAPILAAVAPIVGGQNPVPLRESGVVTNAVQSLNPGAAVAFRTDGSAGLLQRQFTEVQIYQIAQSYDITTSVLAAVAVPLPAAGGVVGRTKISDDNSPLPRDRVILNADYFSNTVLNGMDVTRISPGFEATFLDGMASIEFRFPFASTLDSTVYSNGLTNRATEFGDINVTLKGLLAYSREYAIAAGVGVGIPTGPATLLRGPAGAELLRVKNESYIITPYVAALVTPDDRTFAQVWVQMGFDPTGCPVVFNPAGAGGATIGRLHDQTLLSTDLQLGYWLMRNPYGAGLTGLAPFVELHYNTPLNDGGIVRAGNFVVGTLDNRYDEVNLTLGVAALMADNLLVSAGFVAPLRHGFDRFFDYQVGLRVNWLFGPVGLPPACAPVPYGGFAAAPTTPAMPGQPAAPTTDPLARAPETGTVAAETFSPNFFGDQLGGAQTQRRQVVAGAIVPPQPRRVPILPRYVGLKMSDNDGPRPMDRVYFSYNHYAGVNSSVNPPGTPDIWLDRETVGLETTLGRDVSVGVRVPFLQTGGDPSIEAREIGDLSLVGKYALVNDDAGNVVSVGMILTLPTGGRGGNLGILDDGTKAPRTIFLEPWAGAVLTNGELFAQAVTSVVLPADPVYPTAWFNSVGVGYWLYRNRADTLIQGVVPMAELHINTPLTNRGEEAPIFFRDQVNLTTGVYLQFPRLTVGGAVCVPLVNPKPYDVEWMVNVNYQF